MQVRVDTDKCTGHGRCYAVAPLVFTCDDSGYGELLIEGDIPPEHEAKARSAVLNCPEAAIELIE
jgi:ferredoxin